MKAVSPRLYARSAQRGLCCFSHDHYHIRGGHLRVFCHFSHAHYHARGGPLRVFCHLSHARYHIPRPAQRSAVSAISTTAVRESYDFSHVRYHVRYHIWDHALRPSAARVPLKRLPSADRAELEPRASPYKRSSIRRPSGFVLPIESKSSVRHGTIGSRSSLFLLLPAGLR